eukprot:TRINITY_DN26352_c0_g1_i1.p1 TRINITY_DN26352_c0_g1~~TRINITY_DN26352_c0_g1_i1.p1  ORF type:complete len:680 (+),score=154.05 TRINITY_DN26352_c0_g1_i1:95-2134(+)
MPKKNKKSLSVSSSPAANVVSVHHDGVAEPGEAVVEAANATVRVPSTTKEVTYAAPSGKHYVIAQEEYPEEIPVEIAGDVVTAVEGDLLELLLIQGEWCYGQRFKGRSIVNEGVFRLDWVQGVRVALVDGRREPVEVDMFSETYGYSPPRCTDTAGKLRMKRYRKKIEDVAKFWDKQRESPISADEAEAAVAAAAAAVTELEQEDAAEKARKRKAEKRRKQKARRAAESVVASEAVEDIEAATETVPGEAAEASEASRTPEVVLEAAEASEPDRVEPIAGTDSSGAVGENELDVAFVSSDTSSVGVDADFGKDRKTQGRSNMAWDAGWEQQAARLEQILSESSSGVDDLGSPSSSRGTVNRKRTAARKLTKVLISARRSGQLHEIADEWEKVHSEMATKASVFMALKDKVAQSLLDANRVGDLESIAEEMVERAEQNAVEVRLLKERVFRALTKSTRGKSHVSERSSSDSEEADDRPEVKALRLKLMKRAWKGMVQEKDSPSVPKMDEMRLKLMRRAWSGMIESKGSRRKTHAEDSKVLQNRFADEMADMDGAQKELEMKALQVKNLMKRAWTGMVISKRSKELGRIADEMAEQMQVTVETMKRRLVEGLMRAHQAGELQELRAEFDELGDSFAAESAPSSLEKQNEVNDEQEASSEPPKSAPTKRWCDYSSDSDASRF